MLVQEVAEIDTGPCVVCINLSANSNKKIHANHRKTKTAKEKNQANQVTEEIHFSAVTFNKSISQGSRCEASKQV